MSELVGLRVVVCRSGSQAGPLVEALSAQGAAVVSAPVIAVAEPDDDGVALREALGELEARDWLVVTSPNGARCVAQALEEPLADGVKVAVIGPGTARTAADCGLRVDVLPDRSIAEGLLEVFPRPDRRGGKVVLARAAKARQVLPDGLREMGWSVVDVAAYQTLPAELTEAQRDDVVGADAVVFTSSSTVEQLLAQVSQIPSLVVSIGPATSETAESLGVAVTVEASQHDIDGVVEALVEHVSS